MKLIVGLGNPGGQYEKTRHNAGYLFVEKMVSIKQLASVDGPILFKKEKRFDSLVAETVFDGEKIVFAKPETFMNLSGSAVLKILDYYKLTPSDLIIVSDDIDLPLGSSRIRTDGSSGGQKGLQNIIDQIGSDKFTRVRIGIKPIGGNTNTTINYSKMETSDIVLSKFEKREEVVLDDIIEETIYYILTFLGSKQPIPAHSIQIKFDSM